MISVQEERCVHHVLSGLIAKYAVCPTCVFPQRKCKKRRRRVLRDRGCGVRREEVGERGEEQEKAQKGGGGSFACDVRRTGESWKWMGGTERKGKGKDRIGKGGAAAPCCPRGGLGFVQFTHRGKRVDLDY